MSESLIIRDDGECTLWVALVTAPTRKGLGKKVSGLNWRHDGPAPGTIYNASAHLLRAYHVGFKQWVGVVIMGAYRDV